MNVPIDWPDEISDETAATMADFLYALGDAVANRYCCQIRRYYDDQRQYARGPRRRRRWAEALDTPTQQP